MKKYIALLAALLLCSIAADAQGAGFRDFRAKYKGQKGYTTIEMSGSMFKMVNNVGEKTDKQLSDALGKVKKLTIIVRETPDRSFDRDIDELTDKYEMLSTMDSGDGSMIDFYSDNRNTEFIMVIRDDSTTMVLSIVGDHLDPKQISQYTKISVSE